MAFTHISTMTTLHIGRPLNKSSFGWIFSPSNSAASVVMSGWREDSLGCTSRVCSHFHKLKDLIRIQGCVCQMYSLHSLCQLSHIASDGWFHRCNVLSPNTNYYGVLAYWSLPSEKIALSLSWSTSPIVYKAACDPHLTNTYSPNPGDQSLLWLLHTSRRWQPYTLVGP